MKKRGPSLVLLIFALMVGLGSALAQMTDSSAAASRVAEKLVQAFPKVRGLIVSVEPQGKVVVDLTAKDGIYAGLEMEVFRQGEPFKHPVSGEVMGRMDKTVASLRVVDVQDRFSVGQLLEQDGSVKAGDGVRVTGARILLGLAKVESPPAAEMTARNITRELELALQKTGRFEVFDNRIMRSTLIKAGLKEDISLTDPAALRVLREGLRLSALALPSLGGGGRVLDVQVRSVRTAQPLTVVSVEGVTAVAETPSEPAARPEPPAAKQAARAPAPSPTAPAWIGPDDPKRLNTGFLVAPSAAMPGSGLILGPDFDGTMRAVAVGDLFGDGQPAVAVASSERIQIFAVEKGRKFRHVWTGERSGNNILGLDAIDVNGNGRAELFVTNYYGRRLNSYVLEWQGNEMVPVWREVNLYFRSFAPQGKPALYVQTMSGDKPFAGPVSRLEWRDGKYRVGDSLKLPQEVFLYGMTVGDIFSRGGQQVARIDEANRLVIYEGGQRRYRSSHRWGGTETYMDFEPLNYSASVAARMDQEKRQRIYFEGRLQVADVDGDGKNELVLFENVPAPGYLFEDLRVYEKGKLSSLRWNGQFVEVLWESQELEGYIADFILTSLNGDGALDIVLLVVHPTLLGYGTGRSSLLVYPLQARADKGERGGARPGQP
jgi:hypothetical protein